MRVAVIPARSGSRRVPRKNVKPFLGIPVIGRTITACKESGLFQTIYVTTDDAEIAEIALAYGAQPLHRPPHLAQDHIGTQQVMQHTVRSLRLYERDEVCCVYPATPLLTADDLRASYSYLDGMSYVVAVGTDPLRDIGWLYWGNYWLFAEGRELYHQNTTLYAIRAPRAIDINVQSDWDDAERVYRELHER